MKPNDQRRAEIKAAIKVAETKQNLCFISILGLSFNLLIVATILSTWQNLLMLIAVVAGMALRSFQVWGANNFATHKKLQAELAAFNQEQRIVDKTTGWLPPN